MHPPTLSALSTPGRLALGRSTLDMAAGELLDANGERASLRKQALDVLLVLGRRPGQVVSNDELMAQVWPTVVVSEGSLTQAIADIRRALGEDGHRLVRNVARSRATWACGMSCKAACAVRARGYGSTSR